MATWIIFIFIINKEEVAIRVKNNDDSDNDYKDDSYSNFFQFFSAAKFKTVNRTKLTRKFKAIFIENCMTLVKDIISE